MLSVSFLHSVCTFLVQCMYLSYVVSLLCHFHLFVDNIFGNYSFDFSMIIEYLEYNFLVNSIFPKVPGRGFKIKDAGHDMAIVGEPCNTDAHAKIPALLSKPQLNHNST